MELIQGNLEDIKKKINKLTGGEKVVVFARDDEFNRKMLENGKINFLIFPKVNSVKDKLKQRDSGLNQVLCKIARDNHIIIGVDIKNVFSKNEFDLSRELSRVRQNIKLCKKYNVKIVLINCGKRDEIDLKSFLLTLGMKTEMAKYAVKNRFKI
ncbi:MAG: hypothetical protein U9Q06_02045 [Nanoarchaeota archaeon]|nr:hypothetical protein [Nanoarchaeota archaeon]